MMEGGRVVELWIGICEYCLMVERDSEDVQEGESWLFDEEKEQRREKAEEVGGC
jgi:hypothetical protein